MRRRSESGILNTKPDILILNVNRSFRDSSMANSFSISERSPNTYGFPAGEKTTAAIRTSGKRWPSSAAFLNNPLRRFVKQTFRACKDSIFLIAIFAFPFPMTILCELVILKRSRSNHKNTNCGPYFGSTLNLNTNNETDAAPNSKQFDLNVFSKFSHLFLHVAFEWNQ
nr:hypothetical protein Iba_chr13cCG13530 [Ipomoea batatas]